MPTRTHRCFSVLALLGLVVAFAVAGSADQTTMREGLTALLAQLTVPSVGPGRCVPTPRYPCGGGANQTSSTRRVTIPVAPISSRRALQPVSSRAAAPSAQGVPCRDVPFANNQKGECAQRVRTTCAQQYPGKGKDYDKCVYDGITGTGVPTPALNKTTLPPPQAMPKSWDGSYGANGTLTCTNMSTGKTITKEVREGWTVVNNVVPDINGGRTPISSGGTATFTVQSGGISLTYHLQFTRSGTKTNVRGSATGGGTLTASDGTAVRVQCSFPFSGGRG